MRLPFESRRREIVKETDPAHPENLEQRDYLQVEKDAWNARSGSVISPSRSSPRGPRQKRSGSPRSPSERRALRRNVTDQKGWIVLSPRAEQIVVHSGHAVEEENPELVIEVILDAVKASG